MPKKALLWFSCSLALLLWPAGRAGASCRIDVSCTPREIKTEYYLSEQEYLSSCPHPAGGPNTTYPLCCADDTPEEITKQNFNFSAREYASSLDAHRSPVCGTANETIPGCASCFDGTMLICSGLDQALGETDAVFYDNPPDGVDVKNKPFMFNGKLYQPQAVYFCKENNFGCTQPSCRPLFDSEQPSGGGGPSSPTSRIPRSQTDSRLFFPHVRATSALTYLLQSTFRPISWTVTEIIKNVVYSQVFEHQGINDSTPVINTTANNSSIIPGRPAPTPVFDFSHPPSGVPANGTCVISDIRTNPGDDLLGKKIYADLEYTQKFQYQSLVTGACVRSFQIAPNTGKCCSKDGTANIDPLTGETINYICDPAWITLPTKGKTLVYTKSPFLEYLYQNLVAGPAAIYKRFVSQDTAKDIKDTPTQATYLASAKETSRGQSDLNRTPTQIYFPHLGSIYDYFLKNLQKLLRPKIDIAVPQINCDANVPGTNDPRVIPKDRLIPIYQNPYPGNHIDQCYNDLISKNNNNYDPAFTMAIWLEESGGSDYSQFPTVADFGCAVNTPRADFNAQLSCFLSLKNSYAADKYKRCRINPDVLTMEDFLLIYSEGTRACYKNDQTFEPQDPACFRQFCSNPQFPDRIKEYYKTISGGKTLNFNQVLVEIK